MSTPSLASGETMRRRGQSFPAQPLAEPRHPPLPPHHPVRAEGGRGGGAPDAVSWFPYSQDRPWIRFKTEINVVWWVLVVVAFLSRFWMLDYPRYVMFDEVHFGKFASYYLTGSFFFDVHPPLGKMVFAAIGYLNHFDGSFLFSTIGLEFPPAVPYVIMRSTSAIAGSLLVPIVYEIMLELGFSHRAATLASIFTILDNSLVIQSRVIMLDAFLIFFTYLSILCFLKFYHMRHQPFSPLWHRWLLATGVSLGILLGVKYTGLLGLACVGLLTVCDLWQLLGDPTQDLADLFLHTLTRGVYLLGPSLAISLGLFWLHFALLTNSGPGDAFVSQAFRNTLEPSAAPDVPVNVHSSNATLLRYGSLFTLRHPEHACWLHSHDHLYPLKYPDGRGSSYQQQVTCYEHKDPNNVWVARPPGESNDSSVAASSAPLRSGDIVELVHASSKKLLNSHDVAAPLTPANQEVALYINYSAQFVPHLHWKVDVFGLSTGDTILWEKGRVRIKMVHEHSLQALAMTGKRLPEWGFQQYEVVTDRGLEGSDKLWTVEDVEGPPLTSAEVEEEREMMDNLARGRRNTKHASPDNSTLSFLERYVEIQYHMLTAHGNLGDHQFGAKPLEWPLMGKTLPYWLDEHDNGQVTLMGNPVLWWVGTAAMLVFLFITGFYLLRRRRLVLDIRQSAEFTLWWSSGGVLFVGWLLHFAPYLLLSRVLFLHHYLPALPFQFMMLAAVCDHGYTLLQNFPRSARSLYSLLLLLLCFLLLLSFLIFAPFSYGYPALTRKQIDWRRWRAGWDLLQR